MAATSRLDRVPIEAIIPLYLAASAILGLAWGHFPAYANELGWEQPEEEPSTKRFLNGVQGRTVRLTMIDGHQYQGQITAIVDE